MGHLLVLKEVFHLFESNAFWFLPVKFPSSLLRLLLLHPVTSDILSLTHYICMMGVLNSNFQKQSENPGISELTLGTTCIFFIMEEHTLDRASPGSK